MHLGFAFLADAAQVTPDQKLSVLGGNFDTIYAQEFPAVHALMCLVVNIKAQPTECGREHTLRVEFLDSDGRAQLAPMKLPFTAQTRADMPYRETNVNLIASLMGQQFMQPGEFAFHILVDDLEIGRVPLRLALLPGAPGTPRDPQP